MASAYEVNQVAVKVKNAYSEIDRKRTKAYSDVKESPGWWQGESSNAFTQEYKKINDDIHALLDSLTALEKQLKVVATAITEAEEAAEAAALAAEEAKAAEAAAAKAAEAAEALKKLIKW